MDNDAKVYENRIRRMAARQGLTLIKSRRRDPRALDFGKYALADPAASNAVVFGLVAERIGASLEEIDEYLDKPEPAPTRPRYAPPRSGDSMTVRVIDRREPGKQEPETMKVKVVQR